jgi:hypothetical protein
MGRLRHSYGEKPTDDGKNPYDVLLIHLYDTILVTIYTPERRLIEAFCGACTMTEFRKTKPQEWIEYFSTRESRRIPIKDHFAINAWTYPYKLKATTDSDKRFYKRFEFGEMVEEGNESGDTTQFLIIGTLEEY